MFYFTVDWYLSCVRLCNKIVIYWAFPTLILLYFFYVLLQKKNEVKRKKKLVCTNHKYTTIPIKHRERAQERERVCVIANFFSIAACCLCIDFVNIIMYYAVIFEPQKENERKMSTNGWHEPANVYVCALTCMRIKGLWIAARIAFLVHERACMCARAHW